MKYMRKQDERFMVEAYPLPGHIDESDAGLLGDLVREKKLTKEFDGSYSLNAFSSDLYGQVNIRRGDFVICFGQGIIIAVNKDRFLDEYRLFPQTKIVGCNMYLEDLLYHADEIDVQVSDFYTDLPVIRIREGENFHIIGLRLSKGDGIMICDITEDHLGICVKQSFCDLYPADPYQAQTYLDAHKNYRQAKETISIIERDITAKRSEEYEK